ncbi:hypothetical protein, partial [Salmonella enterica]
AARWLAAPVLRAPATREELAVKLAVAATLPGVDAATILRSQRDASQQRLDELRRTPSPGLAAGSPEDLAWSLVLDSLVCAAEAELRWLDQAEARLAQHPHPEMALELTTERPKRGRPAKTLPSAVAGGDP